MTPQSHPILYTFRRCPYAMRARLAICTAEQTVELRELVLRHKPEHMIEISPKATVPVLQLVGGDVLDESLDVMMWALSQNDPENWLAPEHGNKEEMLSLIHRCEDEFKIHLDRYKYANRYVDADPIDHRGKASLFIDELNRRLSNTTFLYGAHPALADYAIAPFIRQFANTDVDWFKQTPYTAIHSWLDWFLQSTSFIAIMEKFKPWKLGDPCTYRFNGTTDGRINSWDSF